MRDTGFPHRLQNDVVPQAFLLQFQAPATSLGETIVTALPFALPALRRSGTRTRATCSSTSIRRVGPGTYAGAVVTR